MKEKRSGKVLNILFRSISIPLILGIILVLVIGLLLTKTITSSFSGNSSAIADGRVSLQKAKAKMQVDKSYNFPIKDENGEEVSALKYEILNVELRDQIVIKGETATAVKGRTFLIVNLKITNSYTKSVQMNAKDFVRLIVNDSKEQIAPDIHNDPVDVQAISTKYTRLGFPIDDNSEKLKLQIGEISGKKELLPLNF